MIEHIDLADTETVQKVRAQLSKESGASEEQVAFLMTKLVTAYEQFRDGMMHAMAKVMAETTTKNNIPLERDTFDFFTLNYTIELLVAHLKEHDEAYTQQCLKRVQERLSAKSASAN